MQIFSLWNLIHNEIMVSLAKSSLCVQAEKRLDEMAQALEHFQLP